MIADCAIMNEELLTPLMKEANELLAIVVTSIRTAKRNK